MTSSDIDGRRILRLLTIVAFVAGLAYLLVGEHRVHVAGWAPFLLLLLCPVMHMFMHGDHGHRPSGADDASGPATHQHH